MNYFAPARTGNVLVVGSLNLDLSVHTELLPGPGETVTGSELRFSPGGKSSNQAAAAALLGSNVHLVGAVGDDLFGEQVLTVAAAHGVNLDSVVKIPECSTGTALIAVDAQGENNIILSPGANARLTTAEVAAIAEQKWVDADVLCLALEVDIDVVIAAAKRAHRSNTLVVLNPSPLDKFSPKLLALTDILVLNEHELITLLGFPTDSHATALAEFSKLGISQCVVTLGGAGAVVFDTSAADAVVSLPAPNVDAIDTTGCGDAFTGALAHGLANGADLVSAARLGAQVGAYAAQFPGAQASYPDAAALEQFSLSSAVQGVPAARR